MKKRIREFFVGHYYRNTYIIIAVLMLASYFYVRSFMIDMKAFSYVLASELSFNIILLYGLEGTLMAYFLRKKNPLIQVAGIVGGFLFITLVFRFGFGMKTILG